MLNAVKADFSELADTWWKTATALEALPGAEQVRVDWHAHVFEKILVQCGWTVQEWNEVVASKKNKGKNEG